MWNSEWRAHSARWFGWLPFGHVIAAIAVCAVGFTVAGCERPPLRLRRTGDTFIIDVQTLGEYPTSVARMRLTRGRDVVWEVKARDRSPQVHTFMLRVGTNSSVPLECGGGPSVACERSWPSEGYVVLVPAQGGSFRVDGGAEYVLEVWRTESRWSRASATLPP